MRRPLLGCLVAVCLCVALVGGAMGHPDHDNGHDAGQDEAGDRADSDTCPEPGFVSGLVQDVTPSFLKGVIGGLPVPSFVKGFFGAASDC